MSYTIARREFLKTAASVALPAGGERKACILLWQGGGASHLDTFDVKPGGPFRAIPTSAAGVRISECLPRVARHMDKIAVVRSMRAEDTNHERAARLLLDGLPVPASAGSRLPMAEQCLMARRMVERGERFVMVTCPDFDTHRDLAGPLPEFDRAFAGLVADLHERRMLPRTLVVAAGEFGRSPRINAEGGRDHHAAAWSVCLAGAGVAGGRVLGATDAHGAEVIDFPVHPADLTCTVCRIAGLTPLRPGRFISELLA